MKNDMIFIPICLAVDDLNWLLSAKILIIIPAYNEEKNILKTYTKIQDFNNQNGTNYDVIVINDCSTDKTLKICKENNYPYLSCCR